MAARSERLTASRIEVRREVHACDLAVDRHRASPHRGEHGGVVADQVVIDLRTEPAEQPVLAHPGLLDDQTAAGWG
jgi:hypothetical protein